MNEILLFQFTRLRKSEFRSTYGELISIAEKHDPEALHIEAALSRMKDALREVEKLEIPERRLIKSQRPMHNVFTIKKYIREDGGGV